MSSILDNEDEVMDLLGESIINDKIETVMSKYPNPEHGKDAFGRELHVGDYVLFVTSPSGISWTPQNSSTLKLARIKKICPKTISVVTKVICYNSKYKYWRNPKASSKILPSGDYLEDYEYKVKESKLVKIDDIKEFIKDIK